MRDEPVVEIKVPKKSLI